MVCCRPLWASAPLSTSEDHSSQSAQLIGYSKADVKYVPGPPTTNQLPQFSQFVLVEWTESKVRSPKWPHPLPAFTHGRKRNHVVHVYSCHHLAAPREDCSLNFKPCDHPHKRLLVPTGGFQDIFSSVSSSSLMRPLQEVMSDVLKVMESSPHLDRKMGQSS